MTITVKVDHSQSLKVGPSAYVSFPYDNTLIGIIREEPKRYWHAESKLWEIPASRLSKVLNKVGDNYRVELTGVYVPEIQYNYDGFKYKTTPFQHQQEGFCYGIDRKSFLLADEQGLGKTKQVIDLGVARKTEGFKHVLIVCGVNGLKWNWKDEIAIHSDESGHILGEVPFKRKQGFYIGSSKDKLNDLDNLPDDYFLITNVETLRYSTTIKKGSKNVTIYPIADKIKQLCEDGIIGMVAIDEIHKCKNPTSQQGKAIMKLQPKYRIAMTGTPIMNNPLDVYSSLAWLGLEDHTFYKFKQHYCVYGGFGGSEVVGYKNMADLRQLIDNNMLRRLKKDVLDLPPKVHLTEYVEMNPKQTKIYNDVMNRVKDDIDKIKLSNNPLASLIRLRQATGFPSLLTTKEVKSEKFLRMNELVKECVQRGEKVIVFSNWSQMADEAYKYLGGEKSVAIITGDTTDRQAQKEKFMTDNNCKVIVGTIGAMGTGLTLTAATNVIFLDEPWNRALKDQAEDRAHRIGTTGTVNIITLIVKNSIDERIHDIVKKKGETADLLVDGISKGMNRGATIDYLLS